MSLIPVEKIRVYADGENDYGTILYFETSGDLVIFNDGLNAEEKIQSIIDTIGNTRFDNLPEELRDKPLVEMIKHILQNANIVKSVNSKTGEITLEANDIKTSTNSGIETELNKKVDKTGGTLAGQLVAQNNTSYTTKQVRNIILSTANPSGGSNGDVWIKYRA